MVKAKAEANVTRLMSTPKSWSGGHSELGVLTSRMSKKLLLSNGRNVITFRLSRAISDPTRYD